MTSGAELARLYYPGLKPAEAALWRVWLRDHEVDFQRYEYNVYVGQGAQAPPSTLPADHPLVAPLADMWTKLTQRKIDVLAWDGPQPWIIEVKELPGPSILGQLLTYLTWLTRQRDLTLSPQLAVVCYDVGDDMLTALADNGVQVYALKGLAGVQPPATFPPS